MKRTILVPDPNGNRTGFKESNEGSFIEDDDVVALSNSDLPFYNSDEGAEDNNDED